MKRFAVFMFIAVLLTSALSAQGIREQQRDTASSGAASSGSERRSADFRPEMNRKERSERPREAASVTVNGTLKLEKGFVAVESGDDVFVVPMLTRYIGFINGLKEGGKVSVEGKRFRNFIHPEKVTIDGKSYDFIAFNRPPAFEKQKFQHHRDDNRRMDRHNFKPGRRDAPGRDGCNCAPRRGKPA